MSIWRKFQLLVVAGSVFCGAFGSFARADVYATEELSARETLCLTEAIYRESRGLERGEQTMIGMVILARVEDPRWPKTICGVTSSKEFSYNHPKIAKEVAKKPINSAEWLEAYKLAFDLIKDAWNKQFLPRGWECVRWYKISGERLAKLDAKAKRQLHVSEKSLGFFEKLLPIGKASVNSHHTFYAEKKECKHPLPTT